MGIVSVLGLISGKLLNRIKVPAVAGYVLIGVILGGSVVGWLDTRLLNSLGLINDLGLSITELFLTPEKLAEIIKLVDEGVINSSTGKELVRRTQEQGKDPVIIVEEEGLAQLTDSAAIESICQEVIQENPDQVAQYQSGKGGVIGWLIGQVMTKSGGKADPQVVREILEKLLQ